MAMTKLQVLVSEELKADLQKAADEEELDLSSYVRWALRRWLKSQEKAEGADSPSAEHGTTR